MTRMRFMNTHIDNMTLPEAMQAIDGLAREGCGDYVVTPNVDHIVRIESDPEFREIYDNASLVLVDGHPLVWISKWYRTPIREKTSGPDLLPHVCELAAKHGYTMFFLGAAEGVAQRAADALSKRFPGLQVVGTYSPPFGFEHDEREITRILETVHAVRPSIMILGLGTPKQEKFLYAYREALGVPLSLCLGATIDFMAGEVRRAPRWMSDHGLEWFYRLIKEPRRMAKRYLVDDISIVRLVWKYRKKRLR